jgi:predicted PurR-regulated permease PerM
MIESLKKFPVWLRLALIFPLICLNFWLLILVISYLEPLSSILIAAALFAFLLDFPIRFLQNQGINRGWAIGIVFLFTLIILGILAFILVPLIVGQLSELVVNLPGWVKSGTEQLQNFQQSTLAQKYAPQFEEILTQITNKLSNALQSLSSQLLNFIISTISSLVSIILLLVLTVFLVIVGENIWRGIFSWFPSPWDVQLRTSIRKTFTTYFATQAILAGILSVLQTIVFLLLGAPYPSLFGLSIGVATLIPYASAVAIILVSILIALEDFTLGVKVLISAILVGQINDQIIAPRLMGGMTGLNPVWLIIALFIGGKLGGILGLLVAVPIASIIKSTTDAMRNPPAIPSDTSN